MVVALQRLIIILLRQISSCVSLGVLEANFVEPAHDKQGFELTTVLSRPEIKLTVGNAPRRRTTDFPEGEPLVSGRGKSCLVNQNRHGSKFSNKLEKGSSPVNASSEDGSCYEVLHSSIDPSTILLQMKESLKCTSATNGVGQVTTDCNVECSTKSQKDYHEATESLKEIVNPTMAKLLNERNL
ncbi:hypothetical protein C1H46_009340 [Malus baccata]|uniref:Morc S5 domain-containing protein n=1 Tax=Malus baccata TaxID=106549 RepID=A0A540N1V7_MALBA|nr:hypothetical protein C1H46_009340 [Malus baccata]